MVAHVQHAKLTASVGITGVSIFGQLKLSPNPDNVSNKPLRKVLSLRMTRVAKCRLIPTLAKLRSLNLDSTVDYHSIDTRLGLKLEFPVGVRNLSPHSI